MAKTCRTCTFACWNRECGHKWAYDPIRKVCNNHTPRETPLLVDELAKALQEVWDSRFTDGDTAGQYPSGCERPGYTVMLTPGQCEMIQTALARHQEEVGDA